MDNSFLCRETKGVVIVKVTTERTQREGDSKKPPKLLKRVVSSMDYRVDSALKRAVSVSGVDWNGSRKKRLSQVQFNLHNHRDLY